MNERTEFLIERWRATRRDAKGAKRIIVLHALLGMAFAGTSAITAAFVGPPLGPGDAWWWVSLVGVLAFSYAINQIADIKMRRLFRDWADASSALFDYWAAQGDVVHDCLSSGDQIERADREWCEILRATCKETDQQ